VTPPPDRCDLAIVGAGIVGLAAARELARRHPAARIAVLEARDAVATGQTARNSGVVHAGIYYAPGSLKATLCVAGARETRELCAERGIAFAEVGKLIVATRPEEIPALDELERRGRANGVPGLRRLGPGEIGELEPHATGVAALHSPHTAVADFAAVARSLGEDVLAASATVTTGAAVTAIDARGDAVRLRTTAGDVVAGHALVCAGMAASRLAELAGAPADPRIVPFRGAYLRLRRPELVRGLIYPVPDPRLPFLGVHLTRHVDGEVTVGPTALLAPGRLRETLAWPGTYRLARRFWRTGLDELVTAARPRRLARRAARFVPEIGPGDLEPAWSGTRAQALARDGSLVDDFAFSLTPRVLHVRNAPSPAATSALAIARHVADRAGEAFALPARV
jgi:2-hydroxyglutarate dehydrogenase